MINSRGLRLIRAEDYMRNNTWIGCLIVAQYTSQIEERTHNWNRALASIILGLIEYLEYSSITISIIHCGTKGWSSTTQALCPRAPPRASSPTVRTISITFHSMQRVCWTTDPRASPEFLWTRTTVKELVDESPFSRNLWTDWPPRIVSWLRIWRSHDSVMTMHDLIWFIIILIKIKLKWYLQRILDVSWDVKTSPRRLKGLRRLIETSRGN
jgi:hypothetical protein